VRAQPTTGNAIFVAHADGTGVRLLTGIDFVDGAPAWSPDGSRIAYALDEDLYTIGADGSGNAQLTAGASADLSPTWSPDGKTIAFERDHGIWAMNVDGGNQRALGVRGHTPRFSPDGTRIAFERDGMVFVVRADGSGPEQSVSPSNLWSYGPSWAPDGTRLAFNAGGAICTAGIDGTDARRVMFDNRGVSVGGSGRVLDWQPTVSASSGDAPYPCVSATWDLRLTVRTTRTRARVGDNVTFRVVLRNLGPDPATATSFSVLWPEAARFAGISSEQGTCPVETGGPIVFVHCEPGIVFPGRSTAMTVQVLMRGPGPQQITAEMDGFGEPRDTNAANDRDAATVVVGGCTITGTTGSDVLRGTAHHDVICGLGGADVIRGGGGNDDIWGGAGDDLVDGGPGDDRLLGESGQDGLDGGPGDDVVVGGIGSDDLDGGTGSDALHGAEILDRLTTEQAPHADPDSLNGGPGADLLEGGPGRDDLRAGPGNDTVLAHDQNRDQIDCGAGRDRLSADRVDQQRHCERISNR